MLFFRTLGLWRVAAAMLVMIFHFLIYGSTSGVQAAHRLRSLMPLLDMFLMVSGFLIMFRYADRLMVERGSYLHFITRRLARFYPLYLATLVYFVFVGIAVHMGLIGSSAAGRYDFATLPANILLVQGWGFTDTLTFNYVGWTLSAEWFCYLTLPVIVLTHRRYGKGGLVALIAATLLALELGVAAGVIPFTSWQFADTWGAYRAFADFSIGALVAVLVRDSTWGLRSPLPGWALFAVTVALMWQGLGGYPALALLALSIYLAALAERNDPQAMQRFKPLDPIANASFSIYLIHPVIASLMLGIVWRRLLEPAHIVGFYVYWLVPMAVVVALALVSARYFETPLGKLANARLAELFAARRKLSSAA
ncbi:MAG TPA: acyltransferase [Mesorhizobium sp.]